MESPRRRHSQPVRLTAGSPAPIGLAPNSPARADAIVAGGAGQAGGKKMASAMGFFGKLRSAISADARLVEDLADLAGRNEYLVERLTRHAAICIYSGIKAGIEAIAAKESAHAKQLHTIVTERHTWPKFPERSGHEGANNWERLAGDLAALAAIAHGLRRAAVSWEAVDAALAGRLAELAAEDDACESELRRLTLKCDPQALD